MAMNGAIVLLALAGGAVLVSLLAVILGVAAIVRINNSKGQLHGRGLAICALIVGLLGLMGLPMLIFFAGAVPSVTKSRVVIPAPMPAAVPVTVVPPPRNPRARRRIIIPTAPQPDTETEKDTDVIEPVERDTMTVQPETVDPEEAPVPKAAKIQEF